MKKLLCAMVLLLLAIPAVLGVWGFALPAQYGATFVAALPAKRALLRAESEKPRLVIVGGSAVAFGVDSALLAAELPGYQPVNFGLYAALGTRVMLDLSLPDLRAGDIVVVMPEQQQQSLSTYLGAQALWQAADTDRSVLLRLHPGDFAPMLAQFPQFAAAKLRYALTAAPDPADIYRRDSFDAAGDIRRALCPANQMPAGYDPTTPVLFDETTMPTPDFCAALNDYTATLAARGVAVYYHFPPMNAAALPPNADIDQYATALQSKITAPLLGDPHACVLPSGWFFDTNFHLNAAGKTVFTRTLVRDIKAGLGDATPTTITLPAMPGPAPAVAALDPAQDNSDAGYFTAAPRTDGAPGLCLTGVTEEGKRQTTLTVPGVLDGQPVTGLCPGLFADCQSLQTVQIGPNITALPDKLFPNCPALRQITLHATNPAALQVGQHLLDGAAANCTIQVPATAYGDYCTGYAWSPYAAALRPA